MWLVSLDPGESVFFSIAGRIVILFWACFYCVLAPSALWAPEFFEAQMEFWRPYLLTLMDLMGALRRAIEGAP